MKNLFQRLLIVMLLALPFTSFAQDCLDYHKVKCKSKEQKNADGTVNTDGYVYSPDSRSALMTKGQKSEFKFTIHQGRDYRLSICSAEILGEKVQFQLMDFEEGTVLYDNAGAGFIREFEFTVKETRNIKIVITIPDDKVAANNAFALKAKNTDMGCVGVLIETMVAPKTGF